MCKVCDGDEEEAANPLGGKNSLTLVGLEKMRLKFCSNTGQF
jgi:hypothetical protein